MKKIASLALAVALAAVACTASQDSADVTFAPETTAPPATEAPASAEFMSEESFSAGQRALDTDAAIAGAPIDVGVAQVATFGRDIIFRADITVAVTDVAAATDAATREITALGGYVFGQRSTGAPPTSILVFKVPPEDFQEALRRLGDLGELRTQDISSDDVTERIVDLESRINTAEASVERLRALLADAGDITTIAQLENQLLERETLLETLRGQLRTLEDQVALATITLSLTEALSDPAISLVVSAYAGEGDSGQACPGEFGGLTIDEGEVATLCFEITNVGDTALADIEFTDRVLDLELGDLTVVAGSATETMQPGESVLLAAEVTVERDLRPAPRVAATPLDAEGQPLPGRTVAATDGFFLDAVDPGGVPTFGEGVEASLGFLKNLGRVVVLALGVALPFLWVPALLWVAWRLTRPRGEPAAPEEAPEEEKELVPAG